MWRMPNGLAYMNVGHTNLNAKTMRAMMEMPDHSKVVMIHDTIPIDFPEYQTEASRAKFVERLTTVINFANKIVVPSDEVRENIEQRMIGTGHRVPVTVAPLGIDMGPKPLDFERSEKPYFVVIGTIEPRKNHALLLDIWDRMNRKMDEDKIPELRIIGARGWRNEDDVLLPGSERARDLDLGWTAVTNSFPLRRLMSRRRSHGQFDVLMISLPDMTPHVVRQSYAREGDGAVWRYANQTSGFSARLTVDKNGLVTDYPDLCSKRD